MTNAYEYMLLMFQLEIFQECKQTKHTDLPFPENLVLIKKSQLNVGYITIDINMMFGT